MVDPDRPGVDLAAAVLAQQRQLVLVGYVLYALTPLTAGLSALLAVALNYSQRRGLQGGGYEPHVVWQIRLFWESLGWVALGFVTVWVFYLGLFFMFLGLLRFIYRLVVGFYCLSRGKPLPLSLNTNESIDMGAQT
jgi:uncharacterized membrane protein